MEVIMEDLSTQEPIAAVLPEQYVPGDAPPKKKEAIDALDTENDMEVIMEDLSTHEPIAAVLPEQQYVPGDAPPKKKEAVAGDNHDPDAYVNVLELLDQLLNKSTQAISLQAAFQPSSTKPDDKKRRYLVWNGIGSISSREESLENRIEIRFTNTSGVNRPEVFPDRTGFTMASLAREGAVFASDPEEESTDLIAAPAARIGSTLHYRAFPGQLQLSGVNESFQFTFPLDEAVLAVAVGKGWIAAATSKKYLRIYSSTGLALSVIRLKGPVVCLCGYDTNLAVVYHNGNPFDDSDKLAVDMYEFYWEEGCRGRCLVSNFPVPLSPNATLYWVGFDVDNKFLMMMDSKYMVSCLMNCIGWQWVPVLDVEDIRKSTEHIYWPIMIKAKKLVYVLLNGENRPMVYPQPVVEVKPLWMPVIASKDGITLNLIQKETNQKIVWNLAFLSHLEAIKDEINTKGPAALMSGGSEEQCSVIVDEVLPEFETVSDTLLLKSFQEACKAELIPLALNFAVLLHTEKAIRVAMTVANHFSRPNVAIFLEHQLEKLTSKQNEETHEQPVVPPKRKNPFVALQELEASPSPTPNSKKPTLNRLSTFSQQARQQVRLSDKRIL